MTGVVTQRGYAKRCLLVITYTEWVTDQEVCDSAISTFSRRHSSHGLRKCQLAETEHHISTKKLEYEAPTSLDVCHPRQQ